MSSLLAGLPASPDPFVVVALAVPAAVGEWLSTVFLDVARGPDLLRLVAVPTFAWAAYRDLETRRVPNRTWLPLLVAGVLALAWDAWLVIDAIAFEQRLFAIQVVLSVGLVAPLGYVFWRLGGFGGADAKAVITLAVLFPVYPFFYVGQGYPVHQATLGVFSLTILSNTVLVGLAYPLALALRNLPRGEITPAMFIGRPVAVDDVLSEYGRLLEDPEGFTRRGLDVDALRMYLRWRGVTLAELRADPDRYRHPLPTARNDPGDGSIAAAARAAAAGGEGAAATGEGGAAAAGDEGAPGAADDGAAAGDDGAATDGGGADATDATAAAKTAPPGPDADGPRRAFRPLDTWGAERFLSAHSAYGTTETELREGLEVLTEPDRETVWLTPGIPFVLPMFVGLLLALTFGDVLFALLSGLGLA